MDDSWPLLNYNERLRKYRLLTSRTMGCKTENRRGSTILSRIKKYLLYSKLPLEDNHSLSIGKCKGGLRIFNQCLERYYEWKKYQKVGRRLFEWKWLAKHKIFIIFSYVKKLFILESIGQLIKFSGQNLEKSSNVKNKAEFVYWKMKEVNGNIVQLWKESKYETQETLFVKSMKLQQIRTKKRKQCIMKLKWVMRVKMRNLRNSLERKKVVIHRENSEKERNVKKKSFESKYWSGIKCERDHGSFSLIYPRPLDWMFLNF